MKERESLIASRKRVIDKIYTNYLKSLVPTEWASHPPLETIYKLDALAEFINNPSDSEVDITAWTHAHNQLPAIMESIRSLNATKKAFLLSLIPADNGQAARKETSLDLAIAIFQCTTCSYPHQPRQPLIGWQSAIYHRCRFGGYPGRIDSEPTLQFIGASTVRAIGSLLGLDMTSATARDFDLRAARFFCLGCQSSSICQLQVLTWREAVCHPRMDISEPAVADNDSLGCPLVFCQQMVYGRLRAT